MSACCVIVGSNLVWLSLVIQLLGVMESCVSACCVIVGSNLVWLGRVCRRVSSLSLVVLDGWVVWGGVFRLCVWLSWMVVSRVAACCVFVWNSLVSWNLVCPFVASLDGTTLCR